MKLKNKYLQMLQQNKTIYFKIINCIIRSILFKLFKHVNKLNTAETNK